MGGFLWGGGICVRVCESIPFLPPAPILSKESESSLGPDRKNQAFLMRND